MAIKAVGLDFFGTIVYMEGDWEECILSMCNRLQHCGYQISKDDFLSRYRAVAAEIRKIRYKDLREVGNRKLVAETLNRMGLEADAFSSEILAATDGYFSLWNLTIAPDALKVLERLSILFRTTLISNFTHSPFIHRTLRRLGIDRFFDHIIISDEFGLRKPHPRIFEHFLELSEVEVEEAVFIGDDLEADIKGAKSIGIKAVHLTRPKKMYNQYNDIHPDHIVSSLTDFLDLIITEYQ